MGCIPNIRGEYLDKYAKLKYELERLIRIKEKQTNIIYTNEIKKIIEEIEYGN